MTSERAREVGGAQRDLARRLGLAGIESAALDARLLLLEATGLTLERLIAGPGRRLSPDETRRLEALGRRRLLREPVSRIRGEREFFGRSFGLDASTLDPRPDTETLVELALRYAALRARPLRILDLGTGSGAILLSLLAELPDAQGLGTDRSDEALAVAQANARRHGLDERARFLRADWCDGLAGGHDVIVANPPYIATDEIAKLAPEVRLFDPPSSLDGGPDGLDAYRAIAGGAGDLLAPAGLCAVEVGFGQAAEVTAVFEEAGWELASFDLAFARDLAGTVRALGFMRPDDDLLQGTNFWVGNSTPKG